MYKHTITMAEYVKQPITIATCFPAYNASNVQLRAFSTVAILLHSYYRAVAIKDIVFIRSATGLHYS